MALRLLIMLQPHETEVVVLALEAEARPIGALGRHHRPVLRSDHIDAPCLGCLEKREEILSEVVREYRDLNVDREERQRREERFERMFEVVAGYLAPAAAEKMMAAGLISPEAAAGISAAGKEISEEIAEEKTNNKKTN
jgi:hypothetical protein